MDSGFIGGVALQKYRRNLMAQAPQGQRDNGDGSATLDTQDRPRARQRPVPAPINTSVSSGPPSQPPPQLVPHESVTSSFVAPTDLNGSSGSKSATTGRRPAGQKQLPEPSSRPTQSAHPEPHKTRKGLPFLKNPMSSLLMRRKASQNSPDSLPLSLPVEKDEPAYDPRIKGTRIHDFSAPRRWDQAARSGRLSGDTPTSSAPQDRQLVAASSPAATGDEEPTRGSSLERSPSGRTRTGPLHDSTIQDSVPAGGSVDRPPDDAIPSRISMQRMPASTEEAMSVKSRESGLSFYSDTPTTVPSHTSSAAGVTRSRNISLSSNISMRSRVSGLPKHMKSTSSRFSFDMVGAAKQEKALEDRHRQRAAEKGESDHFNPRDSRFDDFDEDAFDYDAMMDDDGLEERIPGVNADEDDGEDEYYLEQSVDPDNDQVNFSGFPFQRSEGLLPSAPSDGGASMGTPDPAFETSQQLQESPLPPGPEQRIGQQVPGPSAAGLGIEGMSMRGPATATQATGPQPPQDAQFAAADREGPIEDEDLYFDDGIVGLEDEFAADLARPPSFDGTPFDESIFDNNDTDQYGRPIAGAFAQAQSKRQAAQKASIKRESDMTSRLSAQSELTRSTAHTSLSTGNPPDKEEATGAPCSPVPELDPMEAYQAALAAAAHKAAASGKFQWESTPDREEQGGGGGAPAVEPGRKPNMGPGANDYEFGYENMDDFELDDDAIIAEANASALANDLDGWYGQEFGFYSAPASGHAGTHRSSSGASDSSTEYQYANGGVFGPKGVEGVNRSKSGRVVSREPNLTPITERSEYSNRNSVMSMALPGHGLGTPIQSPGLAQLAMMADRGDEMSLSSLLRLRSKAWGGSQASLTSSRDGSPKSDRGDVPSSPWTTGWSGHGGGGNSNLHARKCSSLSGVGYDSETGSDVASPTVTASGTWHPGHGGSDQGAGPAPPARVPAASQPEHIRTSSLTSDGHGSNPTSAAASATSPTEARWSLEGVSPGGVPGRRRSGMSHRSKSSADSISYMLEEEESGETRWVIERRRIADSGQVETEREVVEGGRI